MEKPDFKKIDQQIFVNFQQQITMFQELINSQNDLIDLLTLENEELKKKQRTQELHVATTTKFFPRLYTGL